ncbi:MAG: pilus assembly protein [Pseudomonadota bacterium]
MRTFEQHSDGAALAISLFLLIAVLVIGVSAARSAFDGEKAARMERDQQLALHAAEAALADAEREIEGGADAQRAALFAPGSAVGFVDGCGSGRPLPNLGLCLRRETGSPTWQGIDLAHDEATVPLGRYTGAAMQVGQGSLPAALPRYIIELAPFVSAGENASAPVSNFYRITAIGFGAHPGTRVVLQSYYRKVTGGTP